VVDAKGRVTSITAGSGGGGLTLSDDTTTAATYYPMIATATSGSATTAKVSSTKLTYNPSTGALSSTSVTSSSDESLKSEWADVCADFIEQLAKAKCGTYNHVDSNRRQVGASAQGIQAFLPEGVEADAKGLLSLAYGNVALVAAIKLAERVIQLEARLNEITKG
jgi:hypothetical protein